MNRYRIIYLRITSQLLVLAHFSLKILLLTATTLKPMLWKKTRPGHQSIDNSVNSFCICRSTLSTGCLCHWSVTTTLLSLVTSTATCSWLFSHIWVTAGVSEGEGEWCHIHYFVTTAPPCPAAGLPRPHLQHGSLAPLVLVMAPLLYLSRTWHA